MQTDFNLTVTVTLTAAPELLTVLQKIARVPPVTVNRQTPPQSPTEMAARQRVIPVNTMQAPAPMPKQQPTYTQAPATQQQAPVNNNPPVTQPTPQQAPTYTPRQYTPAPANIHPMPQQAPVAAAPQYTREQLARATAVLADMGKIQQIQQLFQQFGIQQLTALPKERYGEYATALRGLGVKI